MKKDIDTQFLCKDCERYGLCQYYHKRKEDSYICKYFHLSNNLDKIRAEIKALSPEPTAEDVIDGNPTKDAIWETLADVLQIIDKYNAESEE